MGELGDLGGLGSHAVHAPGREDGVHVLQEALVREQPADAVMGAAALDGALVKVDAGAGDASLLEPGRALRRMCTE